MISIVLSPSEKLGHLMSGAISKILVLLMSAGLYLISISLFGESVVNKNNQLIGGVILSLIGIMGLTISIKKVKKLQKILTNAGLTTATKGEVNPTMISVSHNQAHEVTYAYEINGESHEVFLMTLWHNSCKPEELVVYSNSDHTESILLRRLSDRLVQKIKNGKRN